MTTIAAKIDRYDILEAKDGLHRGVHGASVPSAVGHHQLEPGAMEAKFRIAEVLGIPVNCVARFRGNAGI